MTAEILEKVFSSEMKVLEHHRRSIVKSITYRILGITADSIAAYFFTRDAAQTAGIVIFVNTYSTILYYLHERVWVKIKWGRVRGA